MTTDLMPPPGLEQLAGRPRGAVLHGDEHAATAAHQPGDEPPYEREHTAEVLSRTVEFPGAALYTGDKDLPRATGILRAGAARPTCTPLTSAGTAP